MACRKPRQAIPIPACPPHSGRFQNKPIFLKKGLTNGASRYIISKLSGNSPKENAAIAQSVERILGKDEVASSNLASSSKASEIFGFQRFSFAFNAFSEENLGFFCFGEYG